MMKSLLRILLLSMLVVACGRKETQRQRQPVAEAAGRVLYAGELQRQLPTGLSREDSARRAQAYIDQWIDEALLAERAERQMAVPQEVEQQVQAYRARLLAAHYVQALLQQQPEVQPAEKELRDFYTEHREDFVCGEPMVKGMYVQLPLKSEVVGKMRVLMQAAPTAQKMDELEKLAFRDALKYDYFRQSMVPLSVSAQHLPVAAREALLQQSRVGLTEVHDSASCHLLQIDSLLPKGKVMPYDVAKDEIADRLHRERAETFLQQLLRSLREEAKKKQKIKYHYPQSE